MSLREDLLDLLVEDKDLPIVSISLIKDEKVVENKDVSFYESLNTTGEEKIIDRIEKELGDVLKHVFWLGSGWSNSGITGHHLKSGEQYLNEVEQREGSEEGLYAPFRDLGYTAVRAVEYQFQPQNDAEKIFVENLKREGLQASETFTKEKERVKNILDRLSRGEKISNRELIDTLLGDKETLGHLFRTYLILSAQHLKPFVERIPTKFDSELDQFFDNYIKELKKFGEKVGIKGSDWEEFDKYVSELQSRLGSKYLEDYSIDLIRGFTKFLTKAITGLVLANTSGNRDFLERYLTKHAKILDSIAWYNKEYIANGKFLRFNVVDVRIGEINPEEHSLDKFPEFIEKLNETHKDIKDSRLRFIYNCGHIPQEEQPEELIKILEKFL